MIKLVHCADLHISVKEKAYSISVLDEIVEHANREEVNYLLMAGDTFDSFDDLAALHRQFASSIGKLRGECEVIMVAGNHEEHGRNKRSIASFELGISRGTVVDNDAAPFRLIDRKGIEFLAIPHQASYREYTGWMVPPKQAPLRIAIAHAANDDLSFTGPDTEEDHIGVIDGDLFRRFQVDYASLGHIHKKSDRRIGPVQMVYPGSARVWRKDEAGERRIVVLECDSAIRARYVTLAAAGQYRSLAVAFSLDGKPEVDPTAEGRTWDRADWVHVECTGLVEDLARAKSVKGKWERENEGRVRRFTVDIDGIETCAGISTQEIAKRFLEQWSATKPADIGDEILVWERARGIGLRAIKAQMGGRQ